MASSLLLGIAREPTESVVQQIDAWDDADFALKIATSVMRGGARLMPTQFGEVLQTAGLPVEGVLGDGDGSVVQFAEPMDAQLMKLCRLLDHVGVTIDDMPGPELLEDAARRLEREIICRAQEIDPLGNWLHRLRQQQACRFTTVEVVARHVVEKLFAEAERQLHDLDEPARRRAAERIIEAFERLDAAAQAEIRRHLKIDRLEPSAILAPGAVISLGGIGVATGMGGFASYTLLTSTIASVAGAIGVSLPFHAYIMATSILAFLANPLTIAAALVGGAWLLRSRLVMSARDRCALVLAALAVVAQGQMAAGADPDGRLVVQARRRYREFLDAPWHGLGAYQRAFPAFRRPKYA